MAILPSTLLKSCVKSTPNLLAFVHVVCWSSCDYLPRKWLYLSSTDHSFWVKPCHLVQLAKSLWPKVSSDLDNIVVAEIVKYKKITEVEDSIHIRSLDIE